MARHEETFIIDDNSNGAAKEQLLALAKQVMKLSTASDYDNARLESFAVTYGTREYTGDSVTVVFSHIPRNENVSE